MFPTSPGGFATTKELKEDFVSDLDGTTFGEVIALTLIIIFASVLRKSLSSSFHRLEERVLRDKKSVRALSVDFAIVVLPGVLGLTLLSERSEEICVGLLVAASLCVVRSKQQQEWDDASTQKGHKVEYYSPLKRSVPSQAHATYVWDSLTEYRSILCLYTFISILAVDFKVFPRRFAKAEHYGTGLMDVGVGSFVISDALFSRLDSASVQDSEASAGKTSGGGDKKKGKDQTKKALATSLQLALVGVGRIVATKAISYHEHVGEYGVHWNFFLTLAIVKLVGLAVPIKACGVVGILVAASYQAALLLTGLGEYVNASQRDEGSLFSLNKEGVISLVGYAALHCLARCFAYATHLHSLTERSHSQNTKKQMMGHRHFHLTAAFALGSWALALLLDRTVEKVSRRSVNASYIFWVLANNLTWLFFIYLGRLLLDLDQCVPLLTAMNKFAFVLFIGANLLVGLVNSSVKTLEVGAPLAVATVTAYMGVLCILTHVLYLRTSKGKGKLFFLGKKRKAHSPQSEL